MPANSPLIEIVLELLTNDSIGLPAVQVAGELIAADASFNMRMADAHGPSGSSTAGGMMDHMKAYEREVEAAQRAWTTFKHGIAKEGAFNMETHEALERALREVQKHLDQMK